MNERAVRCPCGSDKSYLACCAPYLDQDVPAPTPEALMRSRYTAFSRDRIDYLKKTWHPETYPDELEEGEAGVWVGLEVIESSIEDDEGEVEFKARLLIDNKLELLHELSFFERIEGRWVYHSGEFLNEGQTPQKVAKSEPCPCGSGKLFKNCHLDK